MTAASIRRPVPDAPVDLPPGPRTTNGAIALANLTARIDALESRLASGQAAVPAQVELAGLLALRGHALGCAADAERSAALAEQAARDAPADGPARLARARARSDGHRFAEALADLDEAARHGADAAAVDAERVVILHATGRSAEALALGRAAAARRPDFASLAALAVLHAERNELAPAEALFTACLARYRGVSPFPVAHLECLRGRMWQRAGDAPRARRWYARAIERVPAYAPARDRTRELDASPGLAEQHSAARPAARDGGEHHVGEGRC